MTHGALRVAILTRAVFPLHGYGGLERHVYDLVRHLDRRGVSVILLTRPPTITRPPTDGVADGHASGMPLHSAGGVVLPAQVEIVPYLTFPFAGRRGTTVIDRSTAYPLFGERAGRLAAALVARGEVDLVHGLGASSLGYARRRLRRTGRPAAPFVFNPQGLEEFGGTDPRRARLKRFGYLPLRRAVRLCARAADRVIATDRSLEPSVMQHLDVPRARVSTIPNAIDLERCDSLAAAAGTIDLRRQYGLAPEAFVLVSAGRVEENKGLHVLAAALSRLGEPGRTAGTPGLPDWRWVIVGDGPYRARFEAAVASAGITARVLLAGRVSDEILHAWYAAADLFVHPTLYEGSSLVTLEAMAHRRPVVAARAGGLPDKVRPGENGWLVAPGDPDALAAAVEDAMADSGRLRSMGVASRRIVERDFAWPAVVDRLLAVYADLLPGRSVP